MALPSAGGAQETFCLRLDLVHGWLFTIDESRVKDGETRQRVLAYKRECYAVLFRHFYGAAQAGGRLSGEEALGAKEGEQEPIQTRRGLVTQARHTFGSPAARELWFKLGLPVVPSMTADPPQGDLFAAASTGKAA